MYKPDKPLSSVDLKQERHDGERLDKLVGKRYQKLVGGKWEANLPGVDYISIIKPEAGASLHVLPYFTNPAGKEFHADFSLTKNGLYGAMPAALKKMGLTKEMIEKRVVEILDQVGPEEFWYDVPQNILSTKDWEEEWGEMEEERGEGRRREETIEDPRRIELLRRQPDALFGFLGDKGYRGFVFKNFIVLEHPLRKNAAFFINFDEEMTEEEIKNSRTNTGRDSIIQKYWEKYAGKGKMFISQLPEGERLRHKPIDNWIEQMVDKLNERNPLPNRDIYSKPEKK